MSNFDGDALALVGPVRRGPCSGRTAPMTTLARFLPRRKSRVSRAHRHTDDV
jgi:hypothetical protein